MALADILPSLCEAVAGMTVEEVQAQIEASPIAGTISDPAALAAMLVRAAADPDYCATLTGDPEARDSTIPPPPPA